MGVVLAGWMDRGMLKMSRISSRWLETKPFCMSCRGASKDGHRKPKLAEVSQLHNGGFPFRLPLKPKKERLVPGKRKKEKTPGGSSVLKGTKGQRDLNPQPPMRGKRGHAAIAPQPRIAFSSFLISTYKGHSRVSDHNLVLQLPRNPITNTQLSDPPLSSFVPLFKCA